MNFLLFTRLQYVRFPISEYNRQFMQILQYTMTQLFTQSLVYSLCMHAPAFDLSYLQEWLTSWSKLYQLKQDKKVN